MQSSLSKTRTTINGSEGTPTASSLPALSPSTSSSVFSSSSAPLLDTLPPDFSLDLNPRHKNHQHGRAPRKSRSGSERRRDVLQQLSSLDRGFVLRIAKEIEEWGGRSSQHPLLIKGVSPSDQQLILLIADYYEGLDSELDWAGIRISKTSPSFSRWVFPPIPLSEALLRSNRTRTFTCPPPTSPTSSSSSDHLRSPPNPTTNAPPTSPRRLSVHEPHHNNQSHDPSSHRNPAMRSNWSSTSSRRGSVQDAATDPMGGYETLIFASIARPLPRPVESDSSMSYPEVAREVEEIEAVYESQRARAQVETRQPGRLVPPTSWSPTSATTYAPPWPEASFMAPVAVPPPGPADTTFINLTLLAARKALLSPQPRRPPTDDAAVATSANFYSSSNDDPSTSYFNGPPPPSFPPQQHPAFFYNPSYHPDQPPPAPSPPPPPSYDESVSPSPSWNPPPPPPSQHPFYATPTNANYPPAPYGPGASSSSSTPPTAYYGQPGGPSFVRGGGGGGGGGYPMEERNWSTGSDSGGGRGGWYGGRRGRGRRGGGGSGNGNGGYRGARGGGEGFEERAGAGGGSFDEGGGGESGAWNPGGMGGAPRRRGGGVPFVGWRRGGRGGTPMDQGAGCRRDDSGGGGGGNESERRSSSTSTTPTSTSFPSIPTSSSYPALSTIQQPQNSSSTQAHRPGSNSRSVSPRGGSLHPLPSRPSPSSSSTSLSRMNEALEEDMARLSVVEGGGESRPEMRGRESTWARVVKEGGRSA